MKIVLSIAFVAIFSIASMSQQLIGTPFTIKKGETSKVGRLKIKLIDHFEEETFVKGSNGKTLVEVNQIYHFEVVDNEIKREFKESYCFKTNDLVVEIIEKVADEVKIVVMTEKQFGEKVLRKAEMQLAFDELSKIETFAIGPTGYAAVTSQGEKLFEKILGSELAETYFIWMLKNGTNEAKLYALYGLQKLKSKNSERYFAEYHDLSVEVQTMSGCEIGMEKFSDVVARIKKAK